MQAALSPCCHCAPCHLSALACRPGLLKCPRLSPPRHLCGPRSLCPGQSPPPPPAPVNSCTSLPRAVAVALWQCRGCRGHSVKDAVSGREGPCPRTACFWAGKAACWRQAGRMFWRGGHGMSLRACPPVPESAVPASGFPVGGPGTCGPRPTPAGLSAGPTASPTCTSHSSRRRCRAPRSSTAWPT